jgi:hypothetical protein
MAAQCFSMINIWHDSRTLNLYTDTTGSLGFGAIFGPYWCYGAWPEH